MALIVQKYGGTSVGTIERIQAVADRVIETKKQGNQVVVVLSAMSGETDRLLSLAKALSHTPTPRELDVLLSTGEQVTIALLSMALEEKGYPAVSYTGGQVHIRTDNEHNKARIVDIEAARVHKNLDGSDTTAVAMAAALKADECRIYTDVDGVYTADPRIVQSAQRLPLITYEEMLEMASLGSKVLQIRSVEFARKYNVNLRVLSSFEEGLGTLITDEDENMEAALISGIAHNRDEAKLTIVGVPDMPGIASQILGPIADANIEVDMIVQNVGLDNSTDFTFTVNRSDFDKALAILQKTAKAIDAKDVSGDNTMFKALADEGINIQMISTSEIKVSVVVAEKYLELGVRTLHTAFGLDNGAIVEANT